MENENSLMQSDLDETLINTEKTLLSSTLKEDNCDQSVIEVKKEIPIIEVLEETCIYFVAEDNGVIHVKEEQVSKATISALENADKLDNVNGMETSKDTKKEDSILRKNESTIADVYLQLDVTDNLDTYLEKERARKLNLSKAKDKKDEQKKADALDKDQKDEDNSTTEKKSSKRSKKQSTKNNECSNDTQELVSTGDSQNVTLNETKSEAPDSELKNPDIKQDNSVKSQPIETDKKENRFVWISNINKTTKAIALKLHLSTHGKVQMTKIVTDGKECFGYAVFETHDDVITCMKNLQNSLFEDREIYLSDKIPDKKQIEKHSDQPNDKELEKKKVESKILDRRDTKIKSENKKKLDPDPLTLKVEDAGNQKRFSEEKRKIEELERGRIRRERFSLERREIERKRRQIERERERERERQREREREREREIRRRERIEQEERRKVELKLEKEKKKLEYERQLIEKEKLELLRYKRKLLSKEKGSSERDSRGDKKPRIHDDFDRKKYPRSEEPTSKHVNADENYWKSDNKSKSNPFEHYKKTNQAACVAPPPPVLSNNYHGRERQWNERKDYDNRQKTYPRKVEGSRNYGIQSENRSAYAERSFPKEQYKHKNYEVMPSHNYNYAGYGDQNYKGQNIPVIRSEPLRSMQRHQNYQPISCPAPPMQDYYSGINYRRPNDYFNHRPSDRKY